MEFYLIFIIFGVFIAALIIYGLFMIFLPEWVGITGQKALDAERSHQGEELAKKDWIEKFQKTPTQKK